MEVVEISPKEIAAAVESVCEPAYSAVDLPVICCDDRLSQFVTSYLITKDVYI
jgi:hypothetical protein